MKKRKAKEAMIGTNSFTMMKNAESFNLENQNEMHKKLKSNDYHTNL